MRRVFTLLFIVLLGGAIAGGVAFFRAFFQAFPALRPGIYVGTLTSDQGEGGTPLFIESVVGSSDLFVAVGDPEIPAQRVVVIDPAGGQRMPLIIVGARQRYRLSGEGKDGDHYDGVYDNPVTSERGRWSVERVEVTELPQKASSELLEWGTIARGLDDIEAKVASAGSSRGVGKSGPLSTVLKVANGEGDSPGGDSKDSAQVDAQRRELDDLVRKVEMEQRLSPEGHLVSLSRESIAREAQWIDEMLKISAPAVSADFVAEYERALKVKALQDQIADERSVIRNLQEGSAYREEQQRAEGEEAFYNGLQ